MKMSGFFSSIHTGAVDFKAAEPRVVQIEGNGGLGRIKLREWTRGDLTG